MYGHSPCVRTGGEPRLSHRVHYWCQPLSRVARWGRGAAGSAPYFFHVCGDSGAPSTRQAWLAVTCWNSRRALLCVQWERSLAVCSLLDLSRPPVHLFPQPVPRIMVQPALPDPRTPRVAEVSQRAGGHLAGGWPNAVSVEATLWLLYSSIPILIISHNIGRCLLPLCFPVTLAISNLLII